LEKRIMDKKALLDSVKKKLACNKENPTELISQLVKVISRDVDPEDGNKIIGDLKKISSDLFKVWKK